MAPLSPCFLGTMMKAMMSASTTFVESLQRKFPSMSKLVSYSVEHEFALWVWNWFSSKVTFEPSQVTPSLIRPLNGLHVLASSKHGASVEINKSGFTPQDTKIHKVDSCCDHTAAPLLLWGPYHTNSRNVTTLAWFWSRHKSAKTLDREMAAIVGEKTSIAWEKTAIVREKRLLAHTDRNVIFAFLH